MALQLVLDENGNYTYQDPRTVKPRPMISNEFEAYESKQQTKLAGDTNIGEQTEKIIRETPGQYTTTFNEQTGQFETKTQGGEITNIPFQAPTGVTPSAPTETALDKVSRITAATKPSSPVDFRGELQAMQNKALKAQRINTLIRGGVDLGVSYFQASKPLNIQQTTTPLLNVAATPVGQSTLGGVGTAGAIGYGAGKLIGAKEKEAQGMGVGAAIGTAVGGPVGGVVGGIIGGVVGGTVICTELYRQNLMSKEDHRLSWNFTVNNFSDTHINGYWYWAVPMVKLMKKNKLVTKFWNHVMSNRTKDIKWRLKKGKFNLLGRLYSMLIENGSYIVGKLISKKHREVLV